MLDNLSADLRTVILVRHVMTPIALVHPVRGDDPSDAVLERMQAKNYYATTVQRGAQVTGWVTRQDLQSHAGQPVEAALREVNTEVVISEGAAIATLLKRFENRNFLLVVGGSGIEGIVTPSDVGRQAGRMHLFMQICALELAVAALLRKHDDLDSCFAQALNSDQRRTIQRRLGRRAQADDVADKVAVLDFIHLLKIGRLLIPGWSDVEIERLDELSRFRNSIVHSPNEVADDGSTSIRTVTANLDLVSSLLVQM